MLRSALQPLGISITSSQDPPAWHDALADAEVRHAASWLWCGSFEDPPEWRDGLMDLASLR